MKKNSFHIDSECIAYEDNVIVVASKPSGLPTQQTYDPNRQHFYGEIQKMLAKRKPTEPYVALHHRLDSDTSGLVLFCKMKTYNKQVAELFSKQLIKKTYLAQVQIPKEIDMDQLFKENNELVVDNFLKTVRKGKYLFSQIVSSGGDRAITHFKRLSLPIEVIKDEDPFIVLECAPKTGRMHQIRVHLQSLGLSVVGDRIYPRIESSSSVGSAIEVDSKKITSSKKSHDFKRSKHVKNSRNLNNASERKVKSEAEDIFSRLMLHAWKIEFFHQHKKKDLTIPSQIPEEFKIFGL